MIKLKKKKGVIQKWSQRRAGEGRRSRRQETRGKNPESGKKECSSSWGKGRGANQSQKLRRNKGKHERVGENKGGRKREGGENLKGSEAKGQGSPSRGTKRSVPLSEAEEKWAGAGAREREGNHGGLTRMEEDKNNNEVRGGGRTLGDKKTNCKDAGEPSFPQKLWEGDGENTGGFRPSNEKKKAHLWKEEARGGTQTGPREKGCRTHKERCPPWFGPVEEKKLTSCNEKPKKRGPVWFGFFGRGGKGGTHEEKGKGIFGLKQVPFSCEKSRGWKH